MNMSGKIGEQLWANYLEGRGWSVTYAPDMRFYDWDIKANSEERELTFEVKYDSKAYWWAERRKTPNQPNLYIEFHNTKKKAPSGIYMSKADYYVYIMKKEEENTAYVYTREVLCKFCETGDFKVVGNSGFGDDNAKGWIPPLYKTLEEDAGFIRKINL
jgi:hypothetical protein